MAQRRNNVVRLGLPVGVVLLAIAALIFVRGCDEKTSNTFAVKIADQWFTLETALTLADQARGLGGRDQIAEDGGMIFVFKRDRERRFWMKDCLVDIDILYLDRRGFIVRAYEMKAVPLRGPNESQAEYESRLRAGDQYPSKGLTRYVIELKDGKIRELGLKRGQKIDLDLNRLKKLADSVDDS